MELICGACHGRLLAEVPGTTVACPHCGTHLQTPAAAPAVVSPPTLELEDDPAHQAGAEVDTVAFHRAVQLSSDQAEIPPREPFPAIEAMLSGAPQSAPLASAPPAELGFGSELEIAPEIPPLPPPGDASAATQAAGGDVPARAEFSIGVAELHDAPAPTASPIESLLTELSADRGADALQGVDAAVAVVPSIDEAGFPSGDLSENLAAAAPATADEAGGFELPVAEPGRDEAAAALIGAPAFEVVRKGVSKTAFLLVLSYASAMTLACAFLLYQRKSNPGTLDLPDLAPPAEVVKGKKHISKRFYLPEERQVPAPNILHLGETRQYGSLKVTPLRVTRGPVEYQFYNADERQKRAPEGPVLKLHLRFENVSADQEFVPLDSELVYAKEVDRKTFESFNHHNFVSNVSDRGTRSKHAYLLDLKPNGSWLVKGQNLDQELTPGQILETFVPTSAEGIESLEGALVWRVQFRKGYNRTSLRGVTTLIEVPFHSDQITDDPTTLPAETPAEGPKQPPTTPPAAGEQLEKTPGTKDA